MSGHRGLRDGRREPLSQPVTRHGKTARHSDSHLCLRVCESAPPFHRMFMGIALSYLGLQARPGVRQGRIASTENGTRRSVSIATRRGTRVRVQRRDRFNSGTRERGSDSGRRRRAPFPNAPGEELRIPWRKGSTRHGLDAKRLGSRSRCGGSRTRASGRTPLRLQSEDLDFLARTRLRVIDPDLKHGKMLL
ncbi:hypothetical protein ACVWWO_003418 [Bradyrhizobium sp. F1.13.1]